MAEIITKPRGTQDIINQDKKYFDYITDKLRFYFNLYSVDMVDIPSFEETKLFVRSVGESTDIVNKEMFNLQVKNEHEQSLRPEFTAGIIRMLIENKLYASPDLPLKLGYFGSIFRYERPQKGRFREIHQGGVEFLDNKLSLQTNVECISLFYFCAKAIMKSDNLYISINHIGSEKTRETWKSELKKYFKKNISNMCEDCQRRLEQNPLRILDCKVKNDIEIANKAPTVDKYLSTEEKEEFENILKQLDNLNIKYVKDPKLVRGLDYYTGVVFELYEKNGDVSLALGGGGKYQNLTKDLNGPEMEGIGFSYGLDRLCINLSQQVKAEIIKEYSNDFYIYSFNKSNVGLLKVNLLSNYIQENGYSTYVCQFDKGMSGALKQATRKNSKYILFVNEDLSLELKNSTTREQEKIDEISFKKNLSERKY